MSGKSNPAGVKNVFRRTWDRAEFEEKAKEREEAVSRRRRRCR